jgi:TfoX/Sxy family transcriptional regulator of competence genes
MLKYYSIGVNMLVRDVNGEYPDVKPTDQSDLALMPLTRAALHEFHLRRLFGSSEAYVGSIIVTPEVLLGAYDSLLDEAEKLTAEKLAAEDETPTVLQPSSSDED